MIERIFGLCLVFLSFGSGKSTFLKNRWPQCGCVVSRDALRFQMLNDDESYFAKEESVWHAFVEAITLSLRDYADATHLGPGSRKKLLKAINAKGYANLNVNVIYFNVPVEVCIERNKQRDGRAQVPEEVIRSMANSFTPPTFKEYLIQEVNEKGEVIHTWQSHV